MGKLSIALVLCVAAVYSSQASTPKVSEAILRQLLVPGSSPQVMVIFQDNSVVFSHINRQVYANELEKASDVISTLKNFAQVSQSGAVEILKANPRTASAFTTFWISNTMFIDGADAVTINHLVSLPEVLEVREQKIAHINPVIVNQANKDSSTLAEWGIEITNADLVHASGNIGLGIVVSSIDTGVRYTHEALRDNYLNNGYSWFDPYTGSQNPVDENGHGTHTMGTIAGSKGIGMAPGSKWIACRGCDTSSCTEAALNACGQFIACPTGPSGGSCDVSKKPHVVNNSWGGGQGDTWYDPIIRSWIAVGVVPVFSNGNSGSFCGSANSPADNPTVIGVGSTDAFDTLSYFSSRGPTVDGEVKPDISAPGSDVRSAYYTSDTAYSSLSGTSMAGPHVAGAVALLLADNPNLTLAQVKSALYDNAERSLGSGGGACDGLPESQFPNHSFGHGRLDILASIGKK